MSDAPLMALPIVLALELAQGSALEQLTLTRDDAAELAGLVAEDLQALIPAVGSARLAVAGALFDAVELLRPGFPVWATLDELARRVPRAQLQHVVAFGSHEGRMPAQPLQPDPIHADGPMRLLPLSLLADEATADQLSEQLEVELVGRGEAGQRTADWLMRAFDVRLEHVRYLSRNDLLAMVCVQYEHVGLTVLWSLLEAALLTPVRPESALSARGLRLRYNAGAVYTQSPAAWLASSASAGEQRAHDFAAAVFELRQYAALLLAHGLSLELAGEPGTTVEAGPGYLAEHFAAAEAGYEPPALVAHEAAGLGVVAVTVSQRGRGGRARALAHGYPLEPRALGALVAALAARYGSSTDVLALGRVMLDEGGALAAPDTPLH